MSDRIQNMRDQGRAEAKSARLITERVMAEGRTHLSAGEKSLYDSHMAKARDLIEKISEAKADQGILDQARALAAEVGGTGGDGAKHLALSGIGRKGSAKTIAAKMMDAGGEAYGRKALIDSGSVVTPTPMQDDVVTMGRVPASLLEVLTVVQRDSPTFKYMRQIARDNQAGIVAVGALKPKSTYTVEGVPNELRVFAHLSDPVDKYLLADVASLERFIADEMLAGLSEAVEEEVLNGDGTSGHLTGILSTSGIQVQAAGADDVTTVRAGITKLETAGHEASIIVLSPTDWAAIETARNTSGAFDLAGPVDRAARKLWGVQVVLSNTVAPRTGLVLDTSVLAVDTDTAGVETKWSDAGELFDRNQLKARTEGRFSVSVFQPSGVVEINLPAVTP